jgi:hypothetical protein
MMPTENEAGCWQLPNSSSTTGKGAVLVATTLMVAPSTLVDWMAQLPPVGAANPAEKLIPVAPPSFASVNWKPIATNKSQDVPEKLASRGETGWSLTPS